MINYKKISLIFFALGGIKMDFIFFKSEIKRKESLEQKETFILDHVKFIFSNHDIYKYYHLLKGYDFKNNAVKVILGWLSLLSGDNMSLMKMIETVSGSHLSNQYKSLFYDLKALSSLSGTPEQRMKYNNQALNLIKDQTDTFFYANVYLTRGQIYTGLNKFRLASEAFHESYQAFFRADMMFPASVAMTNTLLNWFKLAEFDKVIEQSQKILLMTSSFTSKSEPFWDVIKLPLGMTYAVQLKMDLAEEYLLDSKKAIDQLNLIHMHGYLELYLFDVFHYNHNRQRFDSLYEESVKLFESMNYPFLRVILIYGKILSQKKMTASDIQFIDVYYRQMSSSADPLVFLIRQYLSLHHDDFLVSLEDIENKINQFRYHGDMVNLANSLLLLCEYYKINEKEEEMYILLEELLDISHQYNIANVFYRFPMTLWKEIQSINPNISKNVSNMDLLTYKEQEIMSYISKGLTNKDIAQKLYISIGTVKWHINNIYKKLEVKTRIEAINKVNE